MNNQPLLKHLIYQKHEVPTVEIIQGSDSTQVRDFMNKVFKYWRRHNE